jgi:hypothetical protein
VPKMITMFQWGLHTIYVKYTVTAGSGEATGGGFEPPTCLQDNSWDSYKTAEKFFWEGGRGTTLSCFGLLEIVTV